DPNVKLELVCVVDGEIVARGWADQHRPDLEAMGLGSGEYGFTLRLPTRLMDGHHHVVEVKALLNETQHPIKAGTRLVQFDPTDFLKGHVVIENDGLVHGWALNTAMPKEAVRVWISAGADHTVHVEANQHRPDLAELKMGTGHHGF